MTLMTVIYGKFTYGNVIRTIGLFEGIRPDEFEQLLKTVFSIDAIITGIRSQKNIFLPLSLICRQPKLIGQETCELLVMPSNVAETAIQSGKPGEEKADEISSEYVMQEITRFIDGLCDRGFISLQQGEILLELLAENSTLLFSAYSVAISAQDSEYLAEICKDLALSLTTSEGRIACEAQDEVLQVCDQLYINGKITENQLLYLRHLVLIREESVAKVYDEFQEHQSVPMLAKSLFDLSNTHPYHKIVSVHGNNESAKKKDSGLIGVVALMIRSRVITKQESVILLNMIKNENEYVVAAFELFTYDRNLEELQDTLLRCVKLELRKEFNNQSVDDSASTSIDEEFHQNGRLSALLKSVNVVNVWDTVPENFVYAVFLAVDRNQLSSDQGKALCELFRAQYDLVIACWEVFSVQHDDTDFIDSLRRVIRDVADNHANACNSEENLFKSVGEAKRDLLRHSLNLMIKQRLTTVESAQCLYNKYLLDDRLVSTAIANYANNRDVEEFLIALQTLLNSPANIPKNIGPTEKDNDEKNVISEESMVKHLHFLILQFSVNKLFSQSVTKHLLTILNSDVERFKDAYQEFTVTHDTDKLLNVFLAMATNLDASVSVDDDEAVEDGRISLCKVLTRANILKDSEFHILENLIKASDTEIFQLFSAYENSKNIYDLADGLKTILKDYGNMESEDLYLNENSNLVKHSIESKFLHIVQSMALSHIETAALRLAIARNDETVRAAIEDFRETLDEHNLKLKLKEISIQTIESTLSNHKFDSDQNNTTIIKTNYSSNKVNTELKSDFVEEYKDGGENVSSRHAREHVFPILISELVKEHIISQSSGKLILHLFGLQNPGITSALDAYEVDNDMGRLVDALQKLADDN